MQYQYLTLAAGRLAILNVEPTFPDPNDALSSPNGLVALGGDLSPDRILQAYRMGISLGLTLRSPFYGGAQTHALYCFHTN